VKRLRLPETRISVGFGFQPELRVIDYISTGRGDPERGPMVRMRGAEARFRMLESGELAWVRGPRRNELAIVEIDDSIPEGSVVVRDISGVAVSEAVIVSKPDLDTPPGRQVG
jgi:hypothetical protein